MTSYKYISINISIIQKNASLLAERIFKLNLGISGHTEGKQFVQTFHILVNAVTGEFKDIQHETFSSKTPNLIDLQANIHSSLSNGNIRISVKPNNNLDKHVANVIKESVMLKNI